MLSGLPRFHESSPFLPSEQWGRLRARTTDSAARCTPLAKRAYRIIIRQRLDGLARIAWRYPNGIATPFPVILADSGRSKEC